MGLEVSNSNTTQIQSKSDEPSLEETSNEKFNINDTSKSDSEKRDDGDFEVDEDPSMDPQKSKQIQSFYFPKYPIFKDPELELKVKEAEKLVEERNEARLEIESKISFKAILSLRYRLRSESDGVESFDDERLLLREIKQLEGSRSKVKAIAARREKILALEGQNGFVQYELLEEQQRDAKEKKHKLARKIKLMKEQHKAIERELKSLKKELAFADRKRGEAYEGLAELRRLSDEQNACHYKNRLLLRDARALAAKKDIASLEELSNEEVEKFMSHWNSNKTFRDDYLSRNLPSDIDTNLDRDGKADNPTTRAVLGDETGELLRGMTKYVAGRLPFHGAESIAMREYDLGAKTWETKCDL
ncbi:hypothetical protein Syun_012989 [Stephania yunnanensis]|uniref:Uncharacterized protein n=1 Tax=Stephania yunnanensis TaxID=152371 RepID=A0AAP0PI37_9MAGN